MTTNRVPSGVPTGGQFAASVKDEAEVSLTKPGGYEFETLPFEATIQPQAWVNDYAVDAGPAGEFDISKTLAAMDANQRLKFLREVSGPGADLDWVYDEAVANGTANPGHGPYYVSADPDALKSWFASHRLADPLPRNADGSIDVAGAIELGLVDDEFDTRPYDEPKTVSFHGHWEGDTIVVEAIYDGEVTDDRADTGYWDEGLWASFATGSSDAEIAAAMLDEHHDECARIRVAVTDDEMTPGEFVEGPVCEICGDATDEKDRHGTLMCEACQS